ncbi:MAG: rod shape-determining protein MreC [Gallionella sp.]
MMDGTQSFKFFNRGPSPAVRLGFFVVLSMLLMFIDVRYRYLESARSTMSVLLTPVQRLAAMPGELWNYAGDIFITQSEQHKLMENNEALKLQHQSDAAQLSRLQALELENQQFRKLNALPQRNKLAPQLAEIVYAESDVFRRRVLVSKGADLDIRIGQVVMDDTGIVGQITRVYPGLSEVTLITEKDHAVPVQIVRNGLRTIVFGSGDISHLSLRYMPVDADVEDGDILVTSGIDGIYPQGIPVAQVVKVERDPAYPFANVTCLPLAGVDRHRHLLILPDLPNMPERPAQDADLHAKGKKDK